MKYIKNGEEIANFEIYYVRQIGPFLTQFTVDNYERPLEIKLDASAIRSLFSKLFQQSKELSILSALVVEKIKPMKRIDRQQRNKLKVEFQTQFRNLREQLFFEQTRIKSLKPF